MIYSCEYPTKQLSPLRVPPRLGQGTPSISIALAVVWPLMPRESTVHVSHHAERLESER